MQTTNQIAFTNELRKRNLQSTQELNMSPTQNTTVSTSTNNMGGTGSNRRYKRSTAELLADIEKVDELIASGKFNQIEALRHVGLQSSVYHHKKRQMKEPVAKSDKPRKFAHRKRKKVSNKAEFNTQKNEILKSLKANAEILPEKTKASAPTNKEIELLEAKLRDLQHKYDKLKEFVKSAL